MVRVAFALTSASLVSGQDLFLQQRVAGSIHTCLQKCQETDHSKHFNHCTPPGGATDCSETKCCEKSTDTCFAKNAYWAACHSYCKTGIPDSTGETWSCIPLSPPGCTHLQACVAECAPGLESTANSTVTEELDEELQITDGLSKSKCPNKKGLGACVRSCKKSGVGPDHGSHCEEDGRSSCLSSKCCKNPADKCYTKSQYWAACIGECTPGKVNKVDNQIWDCKELESEPVCDPAKYRTCIDECVENC